MSQKLLLTAQRSGMMPFKVQEKELPNRVFDVYAVRDDKTGYPHFLIYKVNAWVYVSAKHFIPYKSKEMLYG